MYVHALPLRDANTVLCHRPLGMRTPQERSSEWAHAVPALVVLCGRRRCAGPGPGLGVMIVGFHRWHGSIHWCWHGHLLDPFHDLDLVREHDPDLRDHDPGLSAGIHFEVCEGTRS